MQYGRFDNEKREYVIGRVDLPVFWTNCIGTGGTCTACSTTRRAAI